MKRSIIVAKRLIELRKNKGVTRNQVHNLVGVSNWALRSWEKGEFCINCNNLALLADFYNVSMDYIAGRTDNPEINR